MFSRHKAFPAVSLTKSGRKVRSRILITGICILLFSIVMVSMTSAASPMDTDVSIHFSQSNHFIALQPDEPADIEANGFVSYASEDKELDDQELIVDLEVTSSEWSTAISPNQIHFQKKGNQSFSLMLSVPTSTPNNTKQILVITGQWRFQNDDTVHALEPVTTEFLITRENNQRLGTYEELDTEGSGLAIVEPSSDTKVTTTSQPSIFLSGVTIITLLVIFAGYLLNRSRD